MKTDLWLYAMLGMANASVLGPRKADSTGSLGAPEPQYKADYPKDDYPKDDSPKDDYPEDDYPEDDYPKDDYKPDYPEDDYKSSPSKSYPDDAYPKNDDYPTNGYDTDEYGSEYPKSKAPKAWKPKTHSPEFFSLKVDAKCTNQDLANNPPADPTPEEQDEINQCTFAGFAIRLEKGIVIATPYNKWWDPKLPIFFVDDDTTTYTVSKTPLELYVDATSGALKYAPVGWLPPNSISTSFYKLGNNPLAEVGPSPSYFAWPTTEGRAATEATGKTWWLCPISYTGQYQVFISNVNFGLSGQGGVTKAECERMSLAAINANPWKSSGY